MSWTTEVIDELCRCKAAGMTFETAWTQTLRKHRPGRRDMGEVAENLFDAARDDAESLPGFLRRVAEDAWKGRRPELRHLAVLLESGEAFPVAPLLQYQAAGVGKYRTAA